MDEDRCRRSFIARELRTLACRMPRLIRRIDDVLRLPQITDAQTIAIELLPERISIGLRVIQAAINADEDCDRLIASMDRLRENFLEGEAAIDRLLKQTVS
jgi:hypothetical protein